MVNGSFVFISPPTYHKDVAGIRVDRLNAICGPEIHFVFIFFQYVTFCFVSIVTKNTN